MNPLFQTMSQNNPLAMIGQIKQNPVQFLAQRGVNIPQGMNDPNEILQHLMKTGRVSQEQYNKAAQAAQMFKG